MNQLIKIIYSLNEIDSSISFDPSLKMSSFKNLINLTQKINLDEYELYFSKKVIPWNDERPIKEVVGKEKVPVFFIKKKLPSPVKNKVIKTGNEKPADTVNYKTKLTIDYFPSRVEIVGLLDKYYEDNGLEKDYTVLHTEGSIEVKFKNSVN
jgi:hypothetical protein